MHLFCPLPPYDLFQASLAECGHGRCRSKLAASVLAGVDNIHIKPGLKVLYLGAASGTSVSHVSDIVGPTGAVYAVEFSHRSGKPCLPESLAHPFMFSCQLHVRASSHILSSGSFHCAGSMTPFFPCRA